MTTAFLLFLRRLLFAKRTLFFAAVAFLPALLALVHRVAQPRNLDAIEFLREWLGPLYLSVPVVLLPMFFGTTAFGEEVEGRTIVYLFTRPRSRRTIVAAKTLAVALASAILLAVGFASGAAILGAGEGPGAIEARTLAARFAGIAALGALAYGSAFTLLGLLVAHPVLWGLALSFGWEGFVGTLPGQFKSFTAMRYLQSLLVRGFELEGKILEWVPVEPDPPSAAKAALVLLALAVAFALLSSRVARRRDFA